MGWSGRFICVQNDPATFLSGLELAMEGLSLSATNTSPSTSTNESTSPVTWVLGVCAGSPGVYRSHLFQFQSVENAGQYSWRRFEAAASLKNSEATHKQLIETDNQLIDCVESASFTSERVILDRYVIQKSGWDGANAK
jgi:hypothetical protein